MDKSKVTRYYWPALYFF